MYIFLNSVFILKTRPCQVVPHVLFTGCVSVTPPPTISTPLFTTTVAPANCTEPLSPQGEP